MVSICYNQKHVIPISRSPKACTAHLTKTLAQYRSQALGLVGLSLGSRDVCSKKSKVQCSEVKRLIILIDSGTLEFPLKTTIYL